MTKSRNTNAKNKDSPVDVKDSSEFISLVAKGQTRIGLRVVVEPSPELELQTFFLADAMQECQHVAVELLANLISLADSARIRIADFEARGTKLIHEVLLRREPQTASTLNVYFKVEDTLTGHGVFTTLRFTCSVDPVLSSTIKNNGGLYGFVH